MVEVQGKNHQLQLQMKILNVTITFCLLFIILRQSHGKNQEETDI